MFAEPPSAARSGGGGGGGASRSASSSSSSSSAAAAPGVGDDGESKEAELVEADKAAIMITLAGDRLTPLADLPYDSFLVSRMLRSVLSSNRLKVPKPLLKLLATCCRYSNGRRAIIQSLFSALSKSGPTDTNSATTFSCTMLLKR